MKEKRTMDASMKRDRIEMDGRWIEAPPQKVQPPAESEGVSDVNR